AHRGHIPRRARLRSHELYSLAIAHRPNDAGNATRYADQIEARATLKRVCGYETEPAVAWHGSRRFSHDVHRGLGQARQHLLRASEVELSQFRENHKADLEQRHAGAPFV